jgi:hypothetical protein
MNHINVLKRAWNNVWGYRALWIFGIILALTAGGARLNGDNPAEYQVNGEDLFPGGEFRMPEISPEIAGGLVAVGLGLIGVVVILIGVVVILIIASVVARYIAQTALIRMVDDYEETGEKRSIREGFRLGWSRTAWRLFLINLLVDLPTAVVFTLLFPVPVGLIVLSALSIEEINTAVGVIGIFGGVGLFLLTFFLAIVVGAALSLLKHFFHRACALEELGVTESIRQGFGIVRRHLADVGLMWLLMIGLGLAWILLMIPVTILLLLLGLLLVGPALVIGGLATLLGGPAMWIIAAVLGIPILMLAVAAPRLFVGGLAEVFRSNVWTLTYREVRALENAEQVQASELGASGLKVAPVTS